MTTNEGTSITRAVPAEIDLREIGLSFTIPAGRNLSRTWRRELRTQMQSRVRLCVSRERLELSCTPPLLVDAQWPAMNMELGGATIHFADARIEVLVSSISGPGEGLVDFTNDAKREVSALLSAGIAGTAMARAGYDPLSDPDVLATLGTIAGNFQKQPSSGSAAEVSTNDMGDPRVEARFALREPFVFESDGAGLALPAGVVLDVRVSGSGDLASIAAAGTTRERVLSAKLQSITIGCEGIEIIAADKPVAALEHVRIDRGGKVTLERMRLLGSAEEAAGMESLFRVIAAAVALQRSGAALEDAVSIAKASPGAIPKVVPGLVEGKIEESLTEAVRALVRERANTIPGLDLREILAV